MKRQTNGGLTFVRTSTTDLTTVNDPGHRTSHPRWHDGMCINCHIYIAAIIINPVVFNRMKNLLRFLLVAGSIPCGYAFSPTVHRTRTTIPALRRSTSVHSAEPSSGLPEIPFVTKTVGKYCDIPTKCCFQLNCFLLLTLCLPYRIGSIQ